MRRSTNFLLSSAILLACLTATGFGQNLLNNAGFEDPVESIGGAGPFTNWEAFSLDGDQTGGGDIANNSTAMPRTGTQSLELAFLGVANSFAGVFQDVSVAPGEMVNFSGWHKSLGDAGGIEIRFEWRDSVANTEISRDNAPAPMPGTDYEMFSFDGVVPAGVDTARVVYNIQSFGAGPNQQVFLDDVSFSAVPEPATLSLMGTAFLMLFGLRRKK
jgi:hypothetical protein